MATYYGTYGQKVQYLASDPTDVQTGQVWYNYTSATLKVRGVTTTNAWSSGGNINTFRSYVAGFGLQTAAVMAGGYTGPVYNNTENYNGTSWTASGAMNSTLYGRGGAGTQTAGVCFGGLPGPSNATEKYNGTSWTTSGTMGTAAYYPFSFGTQTAAISAGGTGPTGTGTQSYNGTSWTTLPANMNTGKNFGGAAGISTAGVVFGGVAVNATELWNGSTWTNSSPMVRAASSPGSTWGMASFGIQTLAIAATGGNNYVNTAEQFNGSTWSSLSNVPYSRQYGEGAGSPGSQGVIFGGDTAGTTPDASLTATAEWDGVYTATKTVTVS